MSIYLHVNFELTASLIGDLAWNEDSESLWENFPHKVQVWHLVYTTVGSEEKKIPYKVQV